jgi:hypothetical protein
MLGRKDYTRKELDDGRARIDEQLRTLAKFEREFFVNLLLTLDRLYVHRLRSSTGKDGNPLNEVELIVDSLLNNDGVFRVDNKSIKYKPEESVSGLAVGDRIELDRAGFEELYGAFMADLEAKFVG